MRNASSQDLTVRFGKGPWTGRAGEQGVLFEMRRGTIFVARRRNTLIAALTLSTRKPWAIDRKYFTASERPLYLTGMLVDPSRQGAGIGRLCIEEAQRMAAAWPADAIRLDAWDAEAGAGEFYRKCGFREVGRATCRTAPLIYFEMLL
jgi:GNAT superfamily N-acetyltransferase